jgi:hypothetical protein
MCFKQRSPTTAPSEVLINTENVNKKNLSERENFPVMPIENFGNW